MQRLQADKGSADGDNTEKTCAECVGSGSVGGDRRGLAGGNDGSVTRGRGHASRGSLGESTSGKSQDSEDGLELHVDYCFVGSECGLFVLMNGEIRRDEMDE